MVRGASQFAEVVSDFMEFMGDGIFVAHGVNFDYGFISHEYERLERRFRYPKLCTCASRRRHYPGHKSYRLGNLCDALGIELKHQSLLNDVRAAAHLLNLIDRTSETSSEINLEPGRPKTYGARGCVSAFGFRLPELTPPSVEGIEVFLNSNRAGEFELNADRGL
jgi:DNA polymerase III epsilon subunit-like protein